MDRYPDAYSRPPMTSDYTAVLYSRRGRALRADGLYCQSRITGRLCYPTFTYIMRKNLMSLCEGCLTIVCRGETTLKDREVHLMRTRHSDLNSGSESLQGQLQSMRTWKFMCLPPTSSAGLFLIHDTARQVLSLGSTISPHPL